MSFELNQCYLVSVARTCRQVLTVVRCGIRLTGARVCEAALVNAASCMLHCVSVAYKCSVGRALPVPCSLFCT
jgi:hypothetical protein